MTKKVRYDLLILLIILLSGKESMRANPFQDSVCHFLAMHHKDPAHTTYDLKVNSLSVSADFTGFVSQQNTKFFSEETKKKNNRIAVQSSTRLAANHFATSLCKRFSENACCMTIRLPFWAHWFYSSSSRNVILRVLRI